MKRNEIAIGLVLGLGALASLLLAFIRPLAGLAFFVGIGCVVVIFFKPFFGLIVYIVLLFIRPQELIPGFARFRIVLVLAVVVLLNFLMHRVFTKTKISFMPTRQSKFMLALLAIVPLSNLANLRMQEAWDGFNDFFTSYILFFLVMSMTDTFARLRKVCWTLVVCTVALAANGLVQHFRGVDLVGNVVLEEDGIPRIGWISLFGDPNDFALLMNTFLPFILVNFFEKSFARSRKVALVIPAVAILLAIFFTNSRGGFISLVAILGFFAYKRWGLLRGAGIGVAFVVLAFLFAPSRMGDINPYEASAGGRVEAWITGLVLLKSRPLLGIGFHNFTEEAGIAAHSAYIQCAADLGIIGYFTWLAMIYTSFSDLLYIEKRSTSPEYVKYAKTVQLSMIGFLGSAVFLAQAYNPILYTLVALTCCMAMSQGLVEERPALLSLRESIIIAGILAMTVVFYKLLAMVY